MQFSLKSTNVGKAKLSKGKMLSLAAHGWEKSYKAILLFLIVSAFVFGWYTWQKSLSGSVWSEQKKQEYLDSQNTAVIFNQKNFEKVVADIELRKKAVTAADNSFRDVFRSY